eukprot:3793057-Prymnesium_polylepis.2
MAARSSSGNFGVPSPVAASHPDAAAKPYCQAYGVGQQSPLMRLLPATMSVNASALWYRNGLR